MAAGYWQQGQCFPREVVASSVCLDYGSQWGNGANSYTSSCTAVSISTLPATSNTFQLFVNRCTGSGSSLTCTAQGSVTRTAVSCDTDTTTGPFNMSSADGVQMAWLVIGVWVAASIFSWFRRVVEGSHSSTT